MATEILRPQDCLNQRMRVSPSFCKPRRNYGYGNGSGNESANPNNNINNVRGGANRKPAAPKPETQRRQQRAESEPSSRTTPTMTKRRMSYDDLKTMRSNNNLVMEKVTLLKRGESFESKVKNGGGPPLYAGSAFAVSPEPSDLPLPSFYKKKDVTTTTTTIVDDSATRDIKRLLRLSL